MTLDELLADLKKEYLASLPLRIDNIRKHSDERDAETLKDDFHKLKGTGKTYGFPELSKLGEIGESICRNREQNVAKAVPILLDLLSEIHRKAIDEESIDLKADPRFSELKTYL